MMHLNQFLLLMLSVLLQSFYTHAFLNPSPRPVLFHRAPIMRSASADASADANTQKALLEEEVRSMRVKEIKAELSKLKISTQDVFEKEQLVQRLLEVRKNGQGLEELRSSTAAASTASSSSSSNTNTNVITAPLYFTGLDTDLKVAAVNMNGGGITINPSDQPYATIKMEVQKGGNAPFTLQLLLDTACSGFVLRPSVVDKYGLAKLSTPVTMTGAGGTTGATGLTQIEQFSLGGETFGPLPAAVQDIGALPSSLDGIVGLSFLSQFAGVDLDFCNGQVSLYKRGSQLPELSEKSLVAQGTMMLIPQLGIYTVDVMMGTRGPVSMLVDSGAANTFLNWNGVNALGISKTEDTNSSPLQRLSSPMGAMGSDNVAMQLTHRIHVSSTLGLGRAAGGSLPGLSLKDSKRLAIDIGDIAILESMRSQNVFGILGIDALMRCSSVRMVFNGPKKEIFLYS
jgi:predicted aspartyl protease